MLRKLIVGSCTEPTGEMDGNSMLPGLDDLIPDLGMDENANADNGIGSDALSLGVPPLHIPPFFMYNVS